MENSQLPEETLENNSETIFSDQEFSMEGYDKHIRQARNAIFVAAGVLVFNLVVLAATTAYYEYLWLDYTIWGAFIAGFVLLGFWTKKKPYTAIICALVLYVLFVALNAFIDITTIYKGIILKIVIISFLVKGLNDAKEAQQIKSQMGR